MTFAGPLVVMETLNQVGFGPMQMPCTTAGVLTLTLTTRPVGMGSTGTFERSPEVLVTELATQHCVLGDPGLAICHQVWSEIVPRIGTVCPTISTPTDEKSVPGPKRQLAFTVLAITMGPESVAVTASVAVAVGVTGVSVKVSVGTIGAVLVALESGARYMLKEVGRDGSEATGMG